MFLDLLGKKVVAFRGYQHKKNKTSKSLDFILLDDGETYVQLDEQDTYAYHDCDHSARKIMVMKNKELWDRLFNKEGFVEVDPVSLKSNFLW